MMDNRLTLAQYGIILNTVEDVVDFWFKLDDKDEGKNQLNLVKWIDEAILVETK